MLPDLALANLSDNRSGDAVLCSDDPVKLSGPYIRADRPNGGVRQFGCGISLAWLNPNVGRRHSGADLLGADYS